MNHTLTSILALISGIMLLRVPRGECSNPSGTRKATMYTSLVKCIQD